MEIPIEEEYQDVLFHLESAIIEADRSMMGGLTDWHVRSAVEGLTRVLGAEARQASPPQVSLTEEDRVIFDVLRQVADFEMGRGGEAPRVFKRVEPRPIPVTPEEILLCLKRIKRSVDRWQKHAGRRGYLDFVGQYV